MTPGEVVDAYYASWTDRDKPFDETRLRTILAPDLDFEGPLAGHRVGADGFIGGVHAVYAALMSFKLVQRLEQGNQVAVLYDCELTRPAGMQRFAEFFKIDGDRIASIKLMYDGTEWRKLG
jgi:ketosteroid isomerase-like protein